ncbi:hypothetical protein [uncultured Endozoicomonas sp.]|uniref:hypothetical protein n=1 Tax=uncultured Endozoicomonas sp. TaxID=432652 RepID=UPI00262672A1|nr:hypothetical protein [uncultured Endozoicomonas sp.]
MEAKAKGFCYSLLSSIERDDIKLAVSLIDDGLITNLPEQSSLHHWGQAALASIHNAWKYRELKTSTSQYANNFQDGRNGDPKSDKSRSSLMQYISTFHDVKAGVELLAQIPSLSTDKKLKYFNHFFRICGVMNQVIQGELLVVYSM